MDLWSTRSETLKLLSASLQSEAGQLEEGFGIIDDCLADYHPFGCPDAHGRVAALMLLKGRNLALGCYSLILDGLGQEAGALLRLLIEVIERLAWYSQDMDRIDKELAGKRLKAGKIAEAIGSQFEKLREFLNETGSHVNIDFRAMRHLHDFRADQLIVKQPAIEMTLRSNMFSLEVFLSALAAEGLTCLEQLRGPQDALVVRYQAWRVRSAEVFSDLVAQGKASAEPST